MTMHLDTLLTNPGRADLGDKFAAAFADAAFSAALGPCYRWPAVGGRLR